jgi:hypothetical protein
MPKSSLPFAAGIWDQIAEEENGTGFVPWSWHGTRERAEAAARKYARDQRARTGGALTWCGGVSEPSGNVYWLRADGSRWCTGEL